MLLHYGLRCVISVVRRNMSSSVKRGALIVVEGGDRCGKTTHCSKLVDALRKEGKMAELIKFPARETPIGHVINEYLGESQELEDHAIHLLFAANRWEKLPEMKRKLNDGVTLIVDRYSYSGVAYSMAKQVEDMNMDWCWQSEVGLLRPDAVLLLITNPTVTAERQKDRQLERFEGELSFQDRVLTIFKGMKTHTWMEIDTSRSIDEVHAEVKDVVDNVIQNLVPEIETLQKYR